MNMGGFRGGGCWVSAMKAAFSQIGILDQSGEQKGGGSSIVC